MTLEMLHRYPPGLKDGEGFLVFNSIDRGWPHTPDYWPIFPNTEEIYNQRMTLSTNLMADQDHSVTCFLKPRWFSRKKQEQVSYLYGHHIWKFDYDAQQQLHWVKILLHATKGECVVRRVAYQDAYAQGWADGGFILVVKQFKIIYNFR